MASPLRLVLLGVVVACVFADVEQKYQQFEAFYGKNSAGDERAARMAAFAKNLELIETLTAADDGNAVYSHLTPFADISMEEFSVRLGLRIDEAAKAKLAAPLSLDVSGLPVSFDWRTLGGVNPVQNQGQCGSCWAFGTVANLEGVGFVSTGKLVKLSEEQLVDCDNHDSDKSKFGFDNNACNGGLPIVAFDDMIKQGWGMELESTYGAYTAGTTKGPAVCAQKKGDEVAFISDYFQVSTNEDQIAAALMQYGVLSIGINAPPLQTYSHGISDLGWLCPAQLDHAVAIVAFGEEKSWFSTKKYWTVRNSWGANWGEQGYLRIARGKGACGVNADVVTVKSVTLKEAGVAV